MAFSILIPIAVTIVGLLYVVVAGKFIPGFRDEGLAILLIIGSWLVYGFLKYITEAFETVFGSRLGSLAFIVAAIIAVVFFIRKRKK